MTTIRIEERYWKAPEDLRRLHALRMALDSIWKLPGLWKADERALVVRCGVFEVGLRDAPIVVDINYEGDFSYQFLGIIDVKRGFRVPLDTFRRLTHPGMADQERDVYETRIAALKAEHEAEERRLRDLLETAAVELDKARAKLRDQREAERDAR